MELIREKKILLIGGSGSLGNEFINTYLDKNTIYVYSRDECKHWNMQLKYNNHKNLHFIIVFAVLLLLKTNSYHKSR